MKCNNCKFLNPDDNKFCINCGSPLSGEGGDGDIDFSDVLGGSGGDLTGSQEDLLKDLEGLSLSTPDIGVAGGDASDDIDLLLSDFEGTISQIILPEEDSEGADAPHPGAVTNMILPGDEGSPHQAPAAPQRAAAAPQSGDMSFDFFETDLSELVGGDSSGLLPEEDSTGAVTRMILPGEEEDDFVAAESNGNDFDMGDESSLFAESEPIGGQMEDPFAGFDIGDVKPAAGPDSGIFGDMGGLGDSAAPPAQSGPDDIPLFESGIFKEGDGLYQPKPIASGPSSAAAQAPQGGNELEIPSFEDMGGEELDSLLAEIGGVVEHPGQGQTPGQAPPRRHPQVEEIDVLGVDSEGLFADIEAAMPSEQEPAVEVIHDIGQDYGQPDYGQPDYGQADYGQAEYGQPASGQGGEDLSLDALDAVLQGGAPEEKSSDSLDDFLKELEGSSPLGVTVEQRPPMVGAAEEPHVGDEFDVLADPTAEYIPSGPTAADMRQSDAVVNAAQEAAAALAAVEELVIDEPGAPKTAPPVAPVQPQVGQSQAKQQVPPTMGGHGQVPPGQFPPGQLPQGQFPQGQYTPGQVPPMGMPPGAFPQAMVPPGFPQPPQGDGQQAGQLPPGFPPGYPPPWWAYYQQQGQQGEGQGQPGPYNYPWPYPFPPPPGYPGAEGAHSQQPQKAQTSHIQPVEPSKDVGAEEIQNILGAIEKEPEDDTEPEFAAPVKPQEQEEKVVKSVALEDFLNEITIDEQPTVATGPARVSKPTRKAAESEEAPSAYDEGQVPPQPDRFQDAGPDELLRELDMAADDDARYAIVQRLSRLLDPTTTPTFIRLLGDQNSEIRECAVEALGNLGDSTAVRPLLRTLGVESQNMRYLCVEALGKVGDVEALDTLIDLLDEEDDNMRYIAAEALGRIGAERAVRPLVALASSADKDLRYIIAKSLGQIGSVEASSLLVRLIDDEDPEVAIQAINAMGAIRDPDTASHLVGLLTMRSEQEQLRAVVAALGKIRSVQAVPHLIKLLNKEGEELIAEVVGALGAIGDPQAVEPVIDKLTSDPSESVQLAAIDALGALGAEEAIPPLVELLERGNQEMKIPIARSLGQMRSNKALAPLSDLLHDADVSVRQSAVAGLGDIENPQAIGRLEKLVNDPDEGVRREVAYALGKIGTEDAIPLLITLLQDADADVSQRSVEGLKSIGRPCVTPLTELLLDASEDVQIKITSVLGQLADVRAVNSLLELVDDASAELRDEIFKALVQIDTDILSAGEVSVVMKESYAWIRYGIARAMGRFNRREAVNLILKIIDGTFTSNDQRTLSAFPDVAVGNLAHEALARIRAACGELLGELNLQDTVKAVLQKLVEADHDTRHWLIYALGYVQKESSVIALIELLKRDDLEEEEKTIAKALRRIRIKMVVEKLLEAISSASARNRRKLAYTLGMLADTRSLSKLGEMLTDADEGVRLEALKALSKIGSREAFNGIAESVKDASERIRRTAVEVLARMPDERAIPVLGTALHDRSSAVRVAAAAALGANRNEKTFPLLIAGLKDESSDVRSSIVKTLGEMGNRAAVEQLVPMLKDINSQVRHETVRTLGKIGDVRAVVSLLEAMDDHDLWVKTEAAKTLRSLGEKALPNLVEALSHPLAEIQRHAVDVLSEMASPRLHHLLISALKNRSKHMRANAAEVFGSVGERRAVVPLLNLLDDRDYEVRERVAQALGDIGDISASIALRQAMKDQNRVVRTAATRALKKIMEANEIS